MASSSVSQDDTNDRDVGNQGTMSKKTKMRSPRNNQQAKQQQYHEDEVKAQSFPQTSDSPILNRTRSKTDRDKLRVGSTSTNSKIRMQRERRRTKRREAYMPSTEGTSTGEEDENDLFTTENQHHTMKMSTIRNGDDGAVPKAPPQANSHHFTRKLSASCRASKSPSDLDADDEDNQDYDSASIVSTSETVILPQAYSNNDGSNIDNASFRAQFQAIHVAGMQQLAAVAAENDSSGLLSESSGSGKDDVTKSLEKEKRDKLALIEQLEQKDQKINHMEKLIKELRRQNEQLNYENQSLKNALSKFKH